MYILYAESVCGQTKGQWFGISQFGNVTLESFLYNNISFFLNSLLSSWLMLRSEYLYPQYFLPAVFV